MTSHGIDSRACTGSASRTAKDPANAIFMLFLKVLLTSVPGHCDRARRSRDFRFAPKADKRTLAVCPLSANSGHCHFQLPGERLAMMLTTLNVITTSLA